MAAKKAKIKLEGEDVRIVLSNGIVRAGRIIVDSPDLFVLTTPEGEEVIIVKNFVMEIWNGLGIQNGNEVTR